MGTITSMITVTIPIHITTAIIHTIQAITITTTLTIHTVTTVTITTIITILDTIVQSIY